MGSLGKAMSVVNTGKIRSMRGNSRYSMLARSLSFEGYLLARLLGY